MKLGGIGRIPEIAHPSRRRLLQMGLGAFLNPRISLGGIDNLGSDALGKILGEFDSKFFREFLSRIIANLKDENNALDIINTSLGGRYRKMKELSEIELAQLGMSSYLSDRKQIESRYIDIINRFGNIEALDILFSRMEPCPLALEDIIDGVMEGEDFMHIGSLTIAVKIGEQEFDIEESFGTFVASRSNGEYGTLYFESAEEILDFFQLPLSLIQKRFDTEGMCIEEDEVLKDESRKNYIGFFLNTTYLTPVEFYKNGFAQKVITELQNKPIS